MEMEYKGVPYDTIKHPFPPIYRQMFFENILCGNVSQTAISIVGLEQQFIEDIYLNNVRIRDSEIDFNLKYVKSIYIKNVTIH